MANDTPNEQQINSQFQQQFGGMNPNGMKLPNSVGVLVLGICSIFPGCVCYGVPGIICAIIALSLSKKAKSLYEANPTATIVNGSTDVGYGPDCAKKFNLPYKYKPTPVLTVALPVVVDAPMPQPHDEGCDVYGPVGVNESAVL